AGKFQFLAVCVPFIESSNQASSIRKICRCKVKGNQTATRKNAVGKAFDEAFETEIRNTLTIRRNLVTWKVTLSSADIIRVQSSRWLSDKQNALSLSNLLEDKKLISKLTSIKYCVNGLKICLNSFFLIVVKNYQFGNQQVTYCD